MKTFAGLAFWLALAAPLTASATPGTPKTLSVLFTATGPALRASMDEIELSALAPNSGAPQSATCVFAYQGPTVHLRLGLTSYHLTAVTAVGTPGFGGPGGPSGPTFTCPANDATLLGAQVSLLFDNDDVPGAQLTISGVISGGQLSFLFRGEIAGYMAIRTTY